MVVAQLNVAGTLLAANRATAYGAGLADRAALEQAVEDLAVVTRDLELDRDRTASAAFAPPIHHSPNAAAAAESLRKEAESTLDTLAVRAAAVVNQAFSSAVGCVPGQFKDALKDLGALGAMVRIDQALGRLVSLALRLIERALDRLSCFFPIRLLGTARDRVGLLADAIGTGDLGVITAAVLDVPAARQEIGTRLAGSALETESLDQGTAVLAGLSERFERVMTMTERVLVAIASAGRLLSLVPAVAPVIPIFLPSASLAAVAAVVMIGCDYVDSGSVLGLVDGVRHVVADACGEMP